MARNSGTNICNGLFCVITLLSGIAFSVLIALVSKKLVEIATSVTAGIGTYSDYYSFPLWIIGFVYIVPGLIGTLSSMTRAKCGYITQMIFSIITLLLMGALFVVALLVQTAIPLASSSGSEKCVSVGNTCSCGNGVNMRKPCSELYSLGSMVIGILAMFVLGWVACFIATISGGVMACSSDDQPPGVYTMLQPHQAGVTVVNTGPVQPAYPQHPGYAQHGYDPQGYVLQPGYDPQGYVLQPGYDPQGYVLQPGYDPQGYVLQPGYDPQGYVLQPGYDPRSQGYAMMNFAYDV